MDSATRPPIPVMARLRTNIGLVVFVVALLLAGSFVVYVFWEGQTSSSPRVISSLLTNGAQSDYAYGGSVSFGFNLSDTHNLLRGAFETNTSLTLSVLTSQEYSATRADNVPTTWYYSTGNIRAANVSLSLSQGEWFMVFDFVNDTGRTIHTFNGTSILSDTHLTITQTFTVAPESLQTGNMVYPYPLSYADLNGHDGSNVAGGLSLNMSQAGSLVFQITNETLGTGGGNGSAPRVVSWVIPMMVSVGAENYTFSHTGPLLFLGASGSNTTEAVLDQGPFPRVVPFMVGFSIQTGAPAGDYLIILTVFSTPLDGQGMGGIATFSIDVLVT